MANNNNNSDGCPVDHGQLAGNSGLEMLKAVNGNVKQGECPVKHTDAQPSTTANQEGCPVKHDQVKIDDRNNMPAVAEQEVWPGQQYPLGRHRVRSAIPKSDFTPTHQPGGKSKDAGCDSSACGKDKEETWVYPSEQQFYNAMKRKGWDPREEDMQVVVAIHNAVNDRAWNEIMKWESLHPECDDPRLKRFIGRPKDLSPKARLKSFIGYAPPFDRHDWYVDRCGKEVRYVIDFYRGAPPKSIFLQSSDGDSPVSMYLDARPALDNFDNVVDIARMKFTRLRTRFRTFFGSD